jgi:hypothetical protein
MYLKRIDILNCEDIATQEVDVPEWGGVVVVRMMSGKERDAFEASVMDVNTGQKKMDNIRAKLVALSVIDPETKELMFTVADIEALGKKSAAALDRVFWAAQHISKITPEDMESLAKN